MEELQKEKEKSQNMYLKILYNLMMKSLSFGMIEIILINIGVKKKEIIHQLEFFNHGKKSKIENFRWPEEEAQI